MRRRAEDSATHDEVGVERLALLRLDGALDLLEHVARQVERDVVEDELDARLLELRVELAAERVRVRAVEQVLVPMEERNLRLGEVLLDLPGELCAPSQYGHAPPWLSWTDPCRLHRRR